MKMSKKAWVNPQNKAESSQKTTAASQQQRTATSQFHTRLGLSQRVRQFALNL